MPIPLYLQQAPVLTDVVQRCVDTAAEVIATYRESRLTFLQGLVRRMMRGNIQGLCKSPFSWDTNYTVWY